MECEGVTVPWGSNGGVLTLVLAYRPPRAPGSEADNGFSSRFCDLLAGLRSPAVVLGDLNFSGIDWDRLHASTGAEKNVLETIQNYFWTQHVDFPTRRDPSTGGLSLLDPVLSTSPELVLGVESQGWFSDHLLYSVDLVSPGGKDDSKELVPNWSKADLDQLATNLGELDWAAELEGSSGQDGWEYIKQRIDEETD